MKDTLLRLYKAGKLTLAGLQRAVTEKHWIAQAEMDEIVAQAAQ